MGSCDHSDEPSISKNNGKFIVQPRNCQFLEAAVKLI
jgi:hypothetical protein